MVEPTRQLPEARIAELRHEDLQQGMSQHPTVGFARIPGLFNGRKLSRLVQSEATSEEPSMFLPDAVVGGPAKTRHFMASTLRASETHAKPGQMAGCDLSQPFFQH